MCAALTACGSTVQVSSTGGGAGSTDTGLGTAGAPLADGSTGSDTVPGANGTTAGAGGSATSGSAPVGGSSSTSGSGPVTGAGTTTGTSASSGSSSPSATGMAAKGPGWDAKTVYIGITTQQDVQQVAQAAGVKSVDSGNQKADVEAMIKHYNSLGGLFGRQIKGVYFDVQTTGNADTQAQAACSAFTQDQRVIAVYAAALVADTPNFRQCLAKARIPVLAGGAQAFDDKVFNDLQGYYNLMPFPSWTRLAPAYVNRLVAQKYFTGWDTALGKASSSAPVKTGFLCPDTPVGRRVGALMNKEMKRAGYGFTDEVYYTSDGSVSGYVLAFKADKVTHVIVCDLGLFVFAEQAESQHYRPRYGISTFNTPVLFLQGTVQPAQLAGSLGLGFIPTLDVDDAHDPSKQDFPSATACRDIAAKSNLSYTPDRRFARAVLYDTCDIVGLIVTGAKSAGSFLGPQLKQGIGVEGARLRSATTFVSGLSPTVHAMPSATRDIYYDGGCQCYQYRGATLRM
ncbi:MAG: hypothetical protein JWO12_1573 [Frankiales bacterium]|nr:hypothetical protein [Frankiales bacterium]